MGVPPLCELTNGFMAVFVNRRADPPTPPTARMPLRTHFPRFSPYSGVERRARPLIEGIAAAKAVFVALTGRAKPQDGKRSRQWATSLRQTRRHQRVAH